MENEAVISKDMKVEIPDSISPPSGMINGGGGVGDGGLARQGSITKYNCLCSPTTHAGSFRCRLHRSPSLQRTRSIESSEAKGTVGANNYVPAQNNSVNAQ